MSRIIEAMHRRWPWHVCRCKCGRSSGSIYVRTYGTGESCGPCRCGR